MEITANAIQEVAIDDNIIFTETAVESTRPCILHREGSGLVTLRGLTMGCNNHARFKVFFGANIAVPTTETVGPISLALAINGESVAPTTMIETPAAVDEYNNVTSSIYIDVPKGCCTQLSVENVGTIPVSVQNANLIVERIL